MEIKKAIELYELMYKRLEKIPFGKHQAKTYKEIIEFIKDCQTAEEAEQKIKNSDYYLEPTRALMLDKLSSYIKAASELEMTLVEETYRKKYDVLKKDYQEVNDPSYLKTAQNQKIEYMTNLENFAKLYNAYIEFKLINPNDIERINSLSKEINTLINSLPDIIEISKKDIYRNLILVNEIGYQEFIKEIKDITIDSINCEDELNKIWDELLNNKEEILKIGQENINNIKSSSTLVVPPKNKDGKYTYTNEVIK